MTDELKPVRCGCGGRPIIEYGEDAMGGNVQECAENARCSERTAKVETVEKPNVFKCSECGQYFHSTAWGSPVEYCSRCGARLEWI